LLAPVKIILQEFSSIALNRYGATGAGQYIIGTFVAGSASETLTVNADVSAQFNLIQVRDVTAVPEPSTMALCAAGLGMLLVVTRKKR
jgi:hypothetical protein